MRLAVAGGTGTVGRYVAAAARGRGHEVVVLSRSAGVDLASGVGLAAAVDGVEAIVDASNPPTIAREAATGYFTDATRHLHEAGHRAGARHLVVLSIVGVDRVPGFGYYQAKLAHEEAALAGPIPASVLRATQFHEFPGQILHRTRRGPVALVPRMRVRPVAARTVGEALAVLAEGDPAGDAGELAGPGEDDLVAMARRFADRRGLRVHVVPVRAPGPSGRAMRAGALLPTSAAARLEGPTFAAWLAGDDPTAVTV